MQICKPTALILAILLTVGGCTAPGLEPMGPSGLSTSTRQEIGRMAIRGPTQPHISLTTALDGKGAAAGKTARDAGLGWLGGTLQAAGETGDPFGAALIASFGIITAPAVAMGGALYGVAAADTGEAVATGNSVLERALEFAPARFRQAMESAFAGVLPVDYEFVAPGTASEQLRAQGFDSVLDLQMESITSYPSSNRIEVAFEAKHTLTLRALNDDRLLVTRQYYDQTRSRNVSAWAQNQGSPLMTELADEFASTSQQIADEFFLAPAIRVAGLEPVSRQRFGTGVISGTVPMFVWSSLDGQTDASSGGVEYEVMIFPKGPEPEAGERTRSTRYVPAEPLLACKRYQWKVRAHYQNFDQPAVSAWSPTYRFKTPCD